MRYAIVITLLAATGVLADGYEKPWGPHNETTRYTTKTVSILTTYCPEPTEITHNGKTYTATKDETITITDCPCVITEQIYHPSTILYTSCPDTQKVYPTKPSNYPMYTTAGRAQYTGAANAQNVGGMMFGAVAGAGIMAMAF